MVEETHLNGEEKGKRHPFKLRIGVTGHRTELNVISGQDPKRPQPDIKAIRAIIREVLQVIYSAVKKTIFDRIEKCDPALNGNPNIDLRIISALASGADQWVADEAIKIGFKLEAVLPFSRDEYLRDFKNRTDAESYEYLIKNATEITELDGKIRIDETGKRKHEGNSYEIAGNEIIMRSDVLIAVWDGYESRGKGGTGQVVMDAKGKGIPVIWIPWSDPEKWRVGLPQDPGDPETEELIGEKDRLIEFIRNLMQTNEMKYHKTLAAYFHEKPLYLDESTIKKPNIRKLVELPWQQTKGKMWDEVTDTLCNLDFIQAKAAAKMTYELVNDFNTVLEVIPDNAENILEEKERKARMDKYTLDLIACAKGEITTDELEIPESIFPWTKAQAHNEFERLKTKLTKTDRLKDFLNFLGHETKNLQDFAHRFANFAFQQAWNFADVGPVGESVQSGTLDIFKSLLLRSPSNRPRWNPFRQDIMVLIGHTEFIRSVSISNDGKWAISGSQDNTCIIWDLSIGKAKNVLKGHTKPVMSVSITPDGMRGISGSGDGTCILWDTVQGKALQTLVGHKYGVNSVSITPDGTKAISGSVDKTCIFWDLSTGKNMQTLYGHKEAVTSVSITADGAFAISGSDDGTCIYWNMKTGKVMATFNEFHGSILSVYMFPDGLKAATSSARICILWNLKSGEKLQMLNRSEAPFTDNYFTFISCTCDGKLLLSHSSNDKDCIVWNLETGNELLTLKGHTYPVTSASITPEGKIAITGSADNTCILWDHFNNQEVNTQTVNTDLAEVHDIYIIPGEKRAISNFRTQNCFVWDLITGEIINKIEGIGKVALAPNGKIAIAYGFIDKFFLWNLFTGQKIHTLLGHSSFVNAVSITPDAERAISGSDDTTCIFWDISNGKQVLTLIGHLSAVSTVSITPDGKRAISGSIDNRCILWDLITGEQLLVLNGYTSSVCSISITPDGRLAVSISYDHKIILWDLKTGKQIQNLVHSDPFNAVSITPDGKKAITYGGNYCIIWDLSTGMIFHILKRHTKRVNAIAITHDGERVISCSQDCSCILWDLKSGQDLGIFMTRSPIRDVASFSNGIILGLNSSEVIFLNIYKYMLCPGVTITTIRKIWSFAYDKYLDLSADCPLCSHRFAPPISVLAAIDEIKLKAGLKPDQSPCLELPDEAWEDPGLLGNCPKCGEKLKFNPFIAGGD